MAQLIGRARPSEIPNPIEIRPYCTGDVERVGAMATRLSRESLYRRFFAGTPQFPAIYLRSLDKVDHWDREVLVAIDGGIDGGSVVGVAEYVRDASLPDEPDLAVIVADGWQRRGVARLLVTELAMLAAARNMSGFRADVLMTNAAALAAIQRGWPGASPVHGAGGLVTFLLPTRLSPMSARPMSGGPAQAAN